MRWSPGGQMMATSSSDGTVKLLDFATEKIIESYETSDSSMF